VDGLTSGDLTAAATASADTASVRHSSSGGARAGLSSRSASSRPREGRGRPRGVTPRRPEISCWRSWRSVGRAKSLASSAIRLWLRKFDVPMPKLRETPGRTIVSFLDCGGKVSELGIVGFGRKVRGRCFAANHRSEPPTDRKARPKGITDRAQGIGESGSGSVQRANGRVDGRVP